MNRQAAVFFERVNMFFGAVADVVYKIILGIFFVKFFHQFIASDFGDN